MSSDGPMSFPKRRGRLAPVVVVYVSRDVHTVVCVCVCVCVCYCCYLFLHDPKCNPQFEVTSCHVAVLLQKVQLSKSK